MSSAHESAHEFVQRMQRYVVRGITTSLTAHEYKRLCGYHPLQTTSNGLYYLNATQIERMLKELVTRDVMKALS